MDYQKLLAQIEQLITPVLQGLGLELAEREFLQVQGRWILRLYIDKPEGAVTLEDCERTSRALEGVLDVEDLIPHRYYLEVSSPGLFRPLRQKRDFERFAGNIIELHTRAPLEGRHHFSGILQGIEGESILIQEESREWRIPFALLKKAKIKQWRTHDQRSTHGIEA